MNLSINLLPSFYFGSAFFLVILSLIQIIQKIHWRRLKKYPYTFHILGASILVLTLLSIMRASVSAGLSIHLIGATATTLMMGWRLAIVAIAMSQGLLICIGKEIFWAWGLNTFIFGFIPVLISFYFCRLLQKILPHNPFIFTLGGGFFGGILALSGVMLSVAGLLYFADVYSWEIIWNKYLKFMIVIIYPEGFINGLFIAGMVAFFPNTLSCFNPETYFK